MAFYTHVNEKNNTNTSINLVIISAVSPLKLNAITNSGHIYRCTM